MDVIFSLKPGDRRKNGHGTEGVTKDRFKLGLFLTFAACGIFALWTVVGHSNPLTKKLISDLVAVLAALTGTVWGLSGMRRHRRNGGSKRGALAANLLTLGTAGYGFGAGIYAYYELVLHVSPFPSWADAGYMVGYITMIAGILLLPSKPMPGIVRARVLIDSLMVVAALVTFSWYFSLGPTVLAGSQTLLGRFLGVSYPVMDLAMMFCVMVLAASSPEPGVRRARNLLAVGVVAFVVADSGLMYQTLKGTYETGQPLDAGWMLTNLLVGQAAAIVRRLPASTVAIQTSKGEEARIPSLLRMLLPYALVPAVGILLFYVSESKTSGPLAAGVYDCAGVLLALIIVRQIFAIAENSRLNRFLQAAYRELEALATVDSMTGLLNHRVFQERLRLELHRGEEIGASVGLLLIDVDRFKQYNDGYGHPAGDQALKTVARVLRENVRETDHAARYGGEEFAVVLPNTSPEEAALVAERIRKACEATLFPHRPVTLSIGVTMGESEAGRLIEMADHALYAAKHLGRNRVVCEGAPWKSTVLQVSDGTERTNALPDGWSIESSRQFGLDRLSPAKDLLEGPTGPVLRALLAMLELRDHDVERHSDRVMRFCLRLAQETNAKGISNISADELSDLHLGSLLHDIGKVGVPDAILNKPGALSEEEWDVVRRHPIEGAELLESFPQLAGAVPVVRSHHERWDGTGYPDGLAGHSIPLGARIFALTDTLDAMSSDRAYRKARPFTEIREEISRMSGKQFDPELVAAFLAVPESEWTRLRGESFSLAQAA